MKKIKLLMAADLRSTHTKKWADVLSGMGIEIHLFGLTEPFEENKNVIVHKGNIANETAKGSEISLKKGGYLLQISRLKRLIEEIKPDLIHSHYASSYGLLGALSKKHPFAISVWGSDVFNFPKRSILHRKVLEYTLSKADTIFSTSQFMANETKKYTDKKIIITPFGVNIDKFCPSARRKQDEIKIGIIKIIHTKYGHEFLVRAFAELCFELPLKNLKLYIYGSGPGEEKLRKLIKELQVEDKISFMGYIMQNEVHKVHKELDIEVYPSTEEAFGVSVVEAMSCGIPVIASRIGGLQYIVEDMKSGFLVPVKEVQPLKERLRELILDEDLRSRLGRGARKVAEEQYDINKNAEVMVQEYERLLKLKK
jgi:glycosyltransferase involved in cell wall biosynthesis